MMIRICFVEKVFLFLKKKERKRNSSIIVKSLLLLDNILE